MTTFHDSAATSQGDDTTDLASPDAPVQLPARVTRPLVLKAADTRVRPVVTLRPMTTADLVDEAFSVLRAQPRTLATCALVVVMPLQVLAAWSQRDLFGGSPLGDIFADPTLAESGSSSGTDVVYLVMLLHSLAASIMAVAVMTIISASFAGRLASTREVLGATVRRSPVVAAAWVVTHLAQLAGCFAFVVGAFYLMGAFLVVAPAIATEGIGPIQGIRRSWRLTASRRWPMVGVGLASGVVMYTLDEVLTLVPQLLALLVGTQQGWVLLAAGNTAVALLTTPLTAAVACLAYLDLRVRTEGLDIEMDAMAAFAEAR